MGVYSIKGNIETNIEGYKLITDLYNKNKTVTNETIALDFYQCTWLDANLSALLWAVIHKMSIEQGITFSADFSFLKNKFDVLFRNGFISDGNQHPDEQASTMPSMYFDTSDKISFFNYISDHLLCHRGMPSISQEIAGKIKEDLLEIFTNTHLHAATTYPFFVSGQYYPRAQLLKFTLVDLGQGFLPKIKLATSGNVNDSLSAIKWALEGNTSKIMENCSGGLGLSSIYQYCQENKGVIEIITGDAYWSSSFQNTVHANGQRLQEEFVGTTINLVFNKI